MSDSSKPLLIMKCGCAHVGLVASVGDYDRWFMDRLGPIRRAVQVVEVFRDQPLPSVNSVAGVLITGAVTMVTDRPAWSERCARWLVKAVESQVPVLGVCYGHQLLADALGGEVGDHPGGWEVGTVSIRLTDAGKTDPLLGVCGTVFDAHVSHRQTVRRPPDGARVLAYNAHEPHHGFVYGDCCWGVQFHPEFFEQMMPTVLQLRRPALVDEGRDYPALVRAIRPTPSGPKLLQRFMALLSD